MHKGENELSLNYFEMSRWTVRSGGAVARVPAVGVKSQEGEGRRLVTHYPVVEGGLVRKAKIMVQFSRLRRSVVSRFWVAVMSTFRDETKLNRATSRESETEMKKLMFVAVAALCGSVFAGDEITSANVVGYQDKSVGKFALTAQNFLKTGGDTKVTFGDIKPNAAFVANGTLQLFTAEGQAGDVFVYQNDPEILEIFEASEGWY